jgi:hypothetical protein
MFYFLVFMQKVIVDTNHGVCEYEGGKNRKKDEVDQKTYILPLNEISIRQGELDANSLVYPEIRNTLENEIANWPPQLKFGAFESTLFCRLVLRNDSNTRAPAPVQFPSSESKQRGSQ